MDLRLPPSHTYPIIPLPPSFSFVTSNSPHSLHPPPHTHTAALGGSLYYGEQRRKEKQEETKRKEKEKRDVEFARSMKMAEEASAGQQ